MCEPKPLLCLQAIVFVHAINDTHSSTWALVYARLEQCNTNIAYLYRIFSYKTIFLSSRVPCFEDKSLKYQPSEGLSVCLGFHNYDELIGCELPILIEIFFLPCDPKPANNCLIEEIQYFRMLNNGINTLGLNDFSSFTNLRWFVIERKTK